MAIPTFRCCLGCKRARACETYQGWHCCGKWKLYRQAVKILRQIEGLLY